MDSSLFETWSAFGRSGLLAEGIIQAPPERDPSRGQDTEDPHAEDSYEQDEGALERLPAQMRSKRRYES